MNKQSQLIEDLEKGHLRKNTPKFKIGDIVHIHNRVIEGKKERIQVYTGTVIAKKGGGLSETFSVYRNAYGCSMEKVFLLHSPRIIKIEVVRSAKVKRAKLYYLRRTTGKATKLKESIGVKPTKRVKEEEKGGS